MDRRPALSLLLTAILCIAANPVVAENWPIEHFKVVHSEPLAKREPDVASGFNQLYDWLTEDDDEALARRAWERLVEGYLHEIGLLYAAQGFLPPDLPTVTDEGQTKFAVYLYDFKESRFARNFEARKGRNVPGFATNGCIGKQGISQPWMAIDKAEYDLASKIALEKKIKRQQANPDPYVKPDPSRLETEWWLYEILAHELFHILQFAYDRRFGSIAICEQAMGTDFVVEGAANGASRYATARKFGERVEKETREPGYLGSFEYKFPFPEAGHKASYNTSSFWFHLAERYGNLGVLAFLMRQPLEDNTVKGRVQWLQSGLADHPAVDSDGLYFVVPHFLAEIASYGGDRYAMYGAKEWSKRLLDSCFRKTLGPEEVAEVTLYKLAPLSGTCVHLSWSDLPEDSRLEIEVTGPGEAELDQLHLGYSHRSHLSGGELTGYRLKTEGCWTWQKRLSGAARREKTCVIEKPFIKKGLNEGVPVKTWMLERDRWGSKGELTLVLSNVPLKPGREELGQKWLEDVTVRAGFASTRSPDQKLGSPEALPPGGGAPGGGPGPTQAMLYGLGGGPTPRGLPSMVSIRIARGGPADSAGRGPQGNYVVIPDGRQQIGLGYTGPLQGTVLRETEGIPTKMISSALCGNPEKPIGQVLVADERKLEVHVQTQLCSVLIGIAEPRIEQEEFLNARFTLPFGWRYFTSSLPQDVVTPGIKAYMKRFNYSIAGLTGLPFPVPIDIENIPLPDTGGGSGAGASQAGGCDCNCGNWEIVRQMPACAGECDPKWKSLSCGPYLEAGLGDLDAETQRYKAEVSQLGVPENVWLPWVMVFRDSGPDIRADMWEDLERYRAQHDPADLAAQRAEIEQEQAEREERASRYDGETLRYRDALRAAGYPEDQVKGLTEVFSISSPSIRQVYWDNIGS